MDYVMNDLEKELYKLIADFGPQAPIEYTVRAMVELAHTMSDLGNKERAYKLMDVADVLKDTLNQIKG